MTLLSRLPRIPPPAPARAAWWRVVTLLSCLAGAWPVAVSAQGSSPRPPLPTPLPTPPTTPSPATGHPSPKERLRDKMSRYEDSVFAFHMHDGVVMPRALLAPFGRADRSTGHPEDGSASTGDFLAAMSFKYAVTQDEKDRRSAARAFEGAWNLEKVTGVPGLFARNLKNTKGWTVDEEWFFFPHEWRDSPSMPGYRYLGDVSSDQLSHLLFGCAAYFDLAAAEAEKTRVAAWIERVYGRILADGLRILDADGKITLWGNFAPDQPHQELNSLLALCHLRLAHHVTGDAKYLAKYRECIEKHGYLRHAMMASVNEPQKYIVPWDDTLAFIAFYHLLKYETDPFIRDQILRAMERYWIRVQHRHRPFYDFVYQVHHPERTALTQASFRELLRSDIKPRRYTEHLRTAKGPMTLEGTWQEGPADELLAYWLARAHGFLDEDEAKIASYPEGTFYSRPKDPRPAPPLPDLIDYGSDPLAESGSTKGMVLVPEGEFLFGSEHGDFDEHCQPARQHTGAFWIDRYEVTAEQFARVMGREVPEDPIARRKPATVTWSEAALYAKRVGKRLPTEREWEKAARGADGRTFPWGEVFDWSFVAWDDAEPVGGYPAGVSPHGCFDMAGNVWEWTADDYGPYPGGHAASLDGPRKVARGGAGFNQRAMLRCSYRGAFHGDSPLLNFSVGFRCVRDAEPAPAREEEY